MVKRRARRKHYDWIKEISAGNVNKFYNSTEWEILREQVLIRDKYTCQFFLGKFSTDKHKATVIKPVEAYTVHHIIPIRERPDLALDINNCVSLSFEAHEIIEERHKFYFKRKNKVLTKEMW